MSTADLKATEARLRAMREAVSEEGWTWSTADQNETGEELLAAGFITTARYVLEWVATPAGRAWLAKNDGKGGKAVTDFYRQKLKDFGRTWLERRRWLGGAKRKQRIATGLARAFSRRMVRQEVKGDDNADE